jgi:4-amino-4-deoxy-L-arabinose transferase-like glycosyltransferase
VVLAVSGITLVAAILRFTRIGHQGFWFDEGNTALLVHLPLGRMLGLLPQSESTPPLYYCVAWVWSRAFGSTEAGLRSLSALAGVAFVPVAYGVGAKLVSRRGGLIVAALAACNPFLVWYSQEARSYSLLVLLSGCALFAFAHARTDPRPRALGAWAVFSGLALATHYYAVVAVVPQAAWLVLGHRRRRDVWIAVGVVGLCGLALVPLALSQNHTGHDSWIGHTPLGIRLGQILPQALIGTNAPARQPLKFVAFALAVVALALLGLAWRRRHPDSARALSGTALAGGLTVAGFVLALVFVTAGSDSLITRNLLALWLPAAVLVGGGMALAAGRALRALGVAAAVALCLIGIVASGWIAFDRTMQRPDWRYVARALGAQRVGAPARALLIQHYRTLLPLSLYLPGLQFLVSREGVPVRELDVISMVSPSQPLCWWGAACNLIPSEMQRTYAIPGFHEAWRRHVLQWTILRLVADRPVRLTPAAVARSLHTTSLRRDELLVQRP